ncbi:4-hydroxybenzoate geranyltransferase [Lachnellula suecica]|uniref:4-hydroxybenzoate geranyltransferase n=1 Tax=Lachnellula suecica TaxID=602035 RepID=A0A8T9C2P8_9HELO|nr:4-hydroxybenzoate geranyltransferase [Lachnellula suecica]
MKSDTNSGVSRPTTQSSSYRTPSTALFNILPSSWIPYAELMRLDRPAGYYAFFWHYAIGLSFAACVASSPPRPGTLVAMATYLAIWVVILRGAVCTWNDNLDQEFDRKVARCRFRPIARGAVSTAQGHIFAVAQVVVGAIMLVPLSPVVSAYAAVMTVILTIYPLGKRITDFPQVILGFGFAIPIFLCCAAIDADPLFQSEWFGPDELAASFGGACLYGASVLWTIIFDTVYAHQDIKDDIKAGVKSLAVRLGDQTKFGLGILGVIQVGLLLGAGYFCRLSTIYFVVSCGGAASALIAMLVLVDLKTPASCGWWFGPGSRLVGASVMAGLLGHYFLRLNF